MPHSAERLANDARVRDRERRDVRSSRLRIRVARPAIQSLHDIDPHPTARRVFNIVAALVLLVLTAPLMAGIALAIRLTSPGPILFSQWRVGIDRRRPGDNLHNGRRRFDTGGRLFRIYKFRTMRVQNGDDQVWATPDDERVTPLGRLLRKYRLDELPQLVNVLRGEMNVVGPRPEQPVIFTDLRSKLEGYALRQRVLPGITGWAQVNHNYDQCLEDVRTKVDYDLEYLREASIARDAGILLRTIPVVLLKKGAW
jgi:lipopolysaccharide/colanic/teichoic acid biosynthesis glycosyltransferase